MADVMDYPQLHLYVGGQWLGAPGRDTVAVVDPGTCKELGRLPCATPEDVDAALESADAAFRAWRAAPALDRATILRRAATLMRDRVDAFARVITLEL